MQFLSFRWYFEDLKETNESDLVNTISSLIEIHDDIIGIVYSINQCYSFQIMFYFINTCSMFLLTLFTVITFKAYFSVDHLLLFIGSSLWNISQVVLVLIIMYIGGSSTQEGQKTSSIVHKILNGSSCFGGFVIFVGSGHFFNQRLLFGNNPFV